MLIFKTHYLYFLVQIIFVSAVFAVQPSFNGLAKKPPMGWNSWNRFWCHIDEQLIRSTADLFVSTGLKDAGYEYIIMDDCWMNSYREPNGTLFADKRRFPLGVKTVADYIHSKGLKFGLYSSPTEQTCQHRPGSYGYEDIDAQNWASWGVDYLKHDWCSQDNAHSPKMWHDLANMTELQRAVLLFSRMADRLRGTGRNITYSLSNCCSDLEITTWAPSVANLWRVSTDIYNGWDSIMYNYGIALNELSYTGSGHWNDADMLEVGNTAPGGKGLNFDEQKTHFALWAIYPAPLIAGNDLRTASPATLSILLNKHLIRINQDPLAKHAEKLPDINDMWVLRKELDDGSYGFVFCNIDNKNIKKATITPEMIGLKSKKMHILNAWTDEISVVSSIEIALKPHNNAAFIITSA